MSRIEWMRRLAKLLGYYEIPPHLQTQADRLYEERLLPEIAAERIHRAGGWT